jgi:tol-pal system protein YbgF
VRKLILLIVAAMAAAGCSTLTPTEDPVYLRITDMEARLLRIERVFENESLIQLASELDRLRSETTTLRGELENLRFESEGAATRQRDLYLDVDQRLQALEQSQPRGAVAPPPGPSPGGFAGAGVAAPNVPEPAPPARPTGTDQQNYQAAFGLIQARRYPEAARAFQEFLSAFPQSPLADDAQFWVAETYFVDGQFQQALPAFQAVIDGYPQSAKVPDALLKIAICHDELDDSVAARTALQQVMRQFPDTTAARLASQRLEGVSP